MKVKGKGFESRSSGRMLPHTLDVFGEPCTHNECTSELNMISAARKLGTRDLEESLDCTDRA
jgi:hypothetical protein